MARGKSVKKWILEMGQKKAIIILTWLSLDSFTCFMRPRLLLGFRAGRDNLSTEVLHFSLKWFPTVTCTSFLVDGRFNRLSSAWISPI